LIGRRRGNGETVTFADYLGELTPDRFCSEQAAWYEKLKRAVSSGRQFHDRASTGERERIDGIFRDWVRTEEIKAWYSEPERGSLFQGPSVSSLTVPCELSEPLRLTGIGQLEEAIADNYIVLHDRHQKAVSGAILENTDKWMSEGLYFGLVIGSKMISQAFGLAVDAGDVVFPVGDVTVDPHEITSHSEDVRRRYFERCRERIACFEGLPELARSELEASLVLADISKPRIEDYGGKILLAPIRCNEICTLLSRHVTRMIREKTGGRIVPRSLMVTIFDTDTPYTYHQIAGYFGRRAAPSLPGLAVLGTSGSIDAFRWLYAYRVSLVAQKIMKSSLYSEVERRFIPFVFFGVLVERDADILLDLDRLGLLRYRGNLSPFMEFCYLVPKIRDHLAATSQYSLAGEVTERLR